MAEVPPVDEADLIFRCRLAISYDARTQHWLRARYTVVTDVDEVRADPMPEPVVRDNDSMHRSGWVATLRRWLRHCIASATRPIRPVIVYVIRLKFVQLSPDFPAHGT